MFWGLELERQVNNDQELIACKKWRSQSFYTTIGLRGDYMERKATFDLIAGEYDKYLPTYPEILFDDLLVYSGIAPSADIFEIGCGTGQATSSLVKKGFTNITCVELGKNLARIASNKFQDHPNIRIINTSFENWKAADSSFDLAISATAFHFIDQEYGYKKVKRILKPLGTLGFFWTIHVPCFDPIHNEIRKIYQRYAPDLDDSKKPTEETLILGGV